jgi:GNAT superfamily N-acetyltransferase
VKHGIRALEREDLPQIAGVYELVVRSGSTTPAPGLAAYFERTVLDHPWEDPEIPSLVYVEADGRISGFIGSHVRRFLLDGQPIRLACGGQLVADHEARRKAVGALLMQRYLAGPQDLTITDTASLPTHAMWGKLKGNEVSLGCVSWTRLFRPLRFAADRRLSEHELKFVRPVWAAVDAVTTRLPRPSRVSRPEVVSEELTEAALVEGAETLGSSLTLRPAYDEAFVRWLFAEMSRVETYGTLVRTLLRDADDGLLGWYVYYLRPGGTSHVLQVMARERDVGVTLDHLFDHARAHGSAALRGRLEPRLLEPLGRRRCILRYEGGSLVHTQTPAILNAIAYGDALLTRMDGEWWMGHHLEALDAAPPPPMGETVQLREARDVA